MRLPDPFIDSTWPGITSCLLRDNSSYIQEELSNNTVIQVTSGNQFYSLSLEYSDLLTDEYDKVMNFFAKIKRSNDRMEVLLPQLQNLALPASIFVAFLKALII